MEVTSRVFFCLIIVLFCIGPALHYCIETSIGSQSSGLEKDFLFIIALFRDITIMIASAAFAVMLYHKIELNNDKKYLKHNDKSKHS